MTIIEFKKLLDHSKYGISIYHTSMGSPVGIRKLREGYVVKAVTQANRWHSDFAHLTEHSTFPVLRLVILRDPECIRVLKSRVPWD